MRSLKNHPSLLYADEIKAIGEPLRALHIDYFSKGRVTQDGRFACLGSNADFVQTYLEKEYYNYSMHMGHESIGRLIIWDAAEHCGQSLELYQVRQVFRLYNGFTLVKECRSYKDYYHFASHSKLSSINSFLAHLDWLTLFTHFLDEKIASCSSLQQAFDITFNLDYDKGCFDVNTNNITDMAAGFVEAYSDAQNKIFYQGRSFRLTEREIEVLHWSSLGKTAEQIAQICSIAKSTVDKHVDNIKKKSQCYTLFQLGELFAEIKNNPLVKL